jgi:WD40 repeat protein
VSGSLDKSVRVWDASTGVELKELKGHTELGQFSCIFKQWHADCVWLIDKSVRVWDASTGVEAEGAEGPHQLGQFSCIFE